MPGKWDKYFRENNIGMDYGNSAWRRKLNYKTLARSTEADSFFIPVIMANYTDEAGTITSEEYFEHLFGNNPTGSFSDYYSEVSYEKFYATGHVYGWYDTDKSNNILKYQNKNYAIYLSEIKEDLERLLGSYE